MKQVLIAEDLKGLFAEKGSFFDRAEITVTTAGTNDRMLQVCTAEAVDLIVTQLDLPGIRTEDLFAIIRGSESLKGISTIICCVDTLANRERSKLCGPNAVITLPVEPALLYLKVQQFLNIAPRMDYRAVMAVAIEGQFKTTPLQFWTVNISVNGMLITGGEPLAKGDGIFFSFYLPGGAHVSGYGEISRVEQQEGASRSFLYGIRFTNIAPDVRSAIEAVVRKEKH